jgi:hypothetical protein
LQKEELEIQSILFCELVMWKKHFEAVKELFWVGRGRAASDAA